MKAFKTFNILQACALFFLTQVNAEVIHQDSELIVQVRLQEGYTLVDGMIVYQTPKGLVLPLSQISDALGIAVGVSAELGLAEGTILKEENVFRLEVKNCTVQYDSKNAKYDCDRALIHDGDIFVEVRQLEKWFPVNFQFNQFSSELVVISREKLPIELKLERERKITPMMYNQRDYDPGYPRENVGRAILDGFSIDEQLSVSRSQSTFGNQFVFNHNSVVNGEVLGFETEAFVRGTQSGLEGLPRLTFSRTDPEGKQLGFLGVRRMEFFDVNYPHTFLVSRSQLRRGAVVSSFPLEVAGAFTSRTYEGDLFSGWDVELYQNEVLIGRQSSDETGRYSFKDIPLFYGRNQFRFVFYGPQGQREETYKTVVVDSHMLKPGTTAWKAGVALPYHGEADRELFQIDQSILSWLAASAAVSRLTLGEGEEPILYKSAGLTGYAGGFIFNGSAVLSDTDNAIHFGSKFSFRSITAGVSHLILSENFRSELYNKTTTSTPLISVTEAELAHPVPIWPSLRMTWSFARQEFLNLEDAVLSFLNRTAIQFNFLYLRHDLNLSMNGDSQSMSGQVFAHIPLFYFNLQSGLTYGEGGIQALDWRIQRRIRESYNIEFSSRSNFLAELNQYRLTLTKEFDFATVSLEGTIDNQNSRSVAFYTTFNLSRDPRGSSFYFNKRLQADAGAASARVWLDKNLNGKFDDKEEPLEGAEISSPQTNIRNAKTDEDGLVFVQSLPAFQPVDLSVSIFSLQNPALYSAKEGVRIVPRPGRPARLDFPVFIAGEIDGIVGYRRSRKSPRGIQIQLLGEDGKIVQTQTTDSEGYYLFERVTPGKYSVRINDDIAKRAAPRSHTVRIDSEGSIETGRDFLID